MLARSGCTKQSALSDVRPTGTLIPPGPARSDATSILCRRTALVSHPSICARKLQNPQAAEAPPMLTGRKRT